MKLQDRVAVVTAGGSGMGQASARRLAADGATVVVADINKESARETVELIESDGGSAEVAEVDVADVDGLKGLFADIDQRHRRLDILFNNAGIPGAAGIEITLEEWDRAVNINMRGAYFATMYALPALRRAEGRGAVIFNASTGGLVGSPGAPLYGMTKGGVVLLMQSLALTLASEGVRVNAVCPGMMDTPMLPRFFSREENPAIEEKIPSYVKRQVPMGRLGQPGEVADVVAFLASDDARFVTGVAMPVDGGYVAK
ncbi:SDR family NAD(P)-dependent oxidoreductase [Streptomyces sp. NEAU-YJ-81]|uniref:SDR family NAD(P)-dependent oxidoreductase n=1 Tax=Streptomyces sp. NEAU-YJ-81 TaxID=2820288 RepID=UPI001ABBF268|nr:glucose 1-dehydrogenase [Streptomyces sp. NEAU-YJ-81]MBO3682247.1 glucose 1-dehydrogenase [Streptomyces sp. NEAU-YJ-81]